MNWPIFLLLFLLWIIAGRVIVHVCKLYIEKKYPSKEFNAGFFIYLMGTCAQAELLHEHIAAWYLNTAMSLKYKPLVKIFDYIFWPASLAPLIIYEEFAKTKKTAE